MMDLYDAFVMVANALARICSNHKMDPELREAYERMASEVELDDRPARQIPGVPTHPIRRPLACSLPRPPDASWHRDINCARR
jgi:hypothetical protein